MIEKINKIIELMQELMDEFPEESIFLDLTRWKKRLIQYRRIKQIQKESCVMSE